MILVATDFSESAQHALEYGMGLAERLGTNVGLLHVFERPPLLTPSPPDSLLVWRDLEQLLPAIEAETHRKLDELAGTVSNPRVNVQTVFRKGIASIDVPKTADELSAELLVMGSHGYTGFARALIGSVAESAVRSAACPVLTVRAGHQASHARLATIVVPLDFSAGSSAALACAVQWAKRLSAQLVIIHVIETWTYAITESMQWVNVLERLRSVVEPLLDTVVAEVNEQGVPATKAIGEGTAYRKIIDVAAEARADLIVMGTHGRRGLRRMLNGSVAERVVRLAGCPVLTVREREST